MSTGLITLLPGLVAAGELAYGALVAGHHEAGMKGRLVVDADRAKVPG
jgi:hypothetical protein